MFDKAWKVVTGLAALALLIAGVYWFATREKPRTMHPLLKEVAEESVVQFAEQVPRVRDLDNLLLIVAGRGNRDEEQQFVRMLEDQLHKAPKYHLETWRDVERQANSTWLGQLYEKLNLIPGEPPRSLEKAGEIVSRLDTANITLDGVLFVDVEEFSEGEEGLGARITLEGVVWSRKQKKVVETLPRITRAIESQWDHRYLSFQITQMNIIGRALLWFALSAAIPWAGIGVVRRVVKRRHNPLNLAMLIGFTMLDLVLAFVLLCALTFGPGTVAMLLLVAAAMGYYNYDACDYIERRLL